MGLVDSLEPMRHLDPPRVRQQLSALRSGQAGGANSWLGVNQLASSRATHSDDLAAEDRRAWASLAVVAIELAFEADELTDRDLVTRKAYLSHLLSRYAPPGELHPSLLPDEVARQCLALAGMSPELAADTRWAFRIEDIDTMRDLRRIRNPVFPAVQLLDHIEDERVPRDLIAWRELLAGLP